MNAFLPINATIRFTSPLLHPSPSHSRGKAFLCPTLKKDDIFAARNKIMCNFVPSHAENIPFEGRGRVGCIYIKGVF